MASFGPKSERKKKQLHPDLIRVLDVAIKTRDFTILEGHRGKELQNQYFESGQSQIAWPDSKHNKKPSEAVDVAPWFDVKPNIRWSDMEAFRSLGNYILGVGAGMGIPLRWGGDWANNLGENWSYKDQKFHDLPHIELV